MKTCLLFFAATLLAACNTMEGLGRDMKSAGETLSNSAADTKEKM